MRPMLEWERGITFAALVLFVAMGIYPPWVKTSVHNPFPGQTAPAVATHAAGYNWVWENSASSIDYQRLGLQWGMLVVCYVAWYFWPRLRETPPPPTPKGD